MNLRLLKLPCFLMLAASLLFVACEKEGPAGPEGPQGPAGPQGPVGSPNVVYSNWLDVKYDAIVSSGDTLGWDAEINAPRLVDSILQKGEVKVYLNAGTATTPAVVPLPTFDPFLLGIIINPYFQAGKIILVASDDASTFTSTQTNQKAWQYRYVIIPGGVSAGGRTMNINWNNYEEVKAYLGLKD